MTASDSVIDRDTLRRIYLVGFMGAGKSSVGEFLAEKLGYRLIDLDLEIEKDAGRGIPQIFREEGEPAFRSMESRALRTAGAGHDVVVACGGGIVASAENREFMRENGITVWLDAPLDVMLERCGGSLNRPLLADRPRMEALLAARLPFYRDARIRIDAAGGTPDQLASRIVSLLSNLG